MRVVNEFRVPTTLGRFCKAPVVPLVLRAFLQSALGRCEASAAPLCSLKPSVWRPNRLTVLTISARTPRKIAMLTTGTTGVDHVAINNDHLIGAVTDADRSLKLRGGRYVPAVPRRACFPLISLLFPLSLDRSCRNATSLRGYAVSRIQTRLLLLPLYHFGLCVMRWRRPVTFR